MYKPNRCLSLLCIVALLALAGAGCTAKMKAARHLSRGERYFDSGKYDQAAIEYKNVLRNAPENATAWSRLGIIYFEDGRLGEARQILAKAEQLDTNNLNVRLKLGSIYLAARQIKDARDEANFILGKAPGNDQAPILLAEASTTPAEISETHEFLKKMAQGGETAPLDTALGTLWLRQGDLRTAETYFRGAVTRDPKFADGYSALGNLDIMRKALDQADHAFKLAADLAPPRSGKVLQYAQFKIVTGDPGASKLLLQDLVKKTPDYLPGWIALAQLAGAEKRYADGITLLGNVLGRDPQNLQGSLLKIRLELQAGKTAQAIADANAISRMFPRAPLVYYQLAEAQLANNQSDKAVANLNQALALNPKYTDAILALAELQIRSGNPAPAIVSMQQLVHEQPKLVPGRMLLAEAYREQGDLDGAIQIYHDLIKAYPKDAQFPFLLGTMFLQQKKNTQARTEFDEALYLAPNYFPALEQMVNVDLVEGQSGAALQRVQQQIRQNPKEPALQLLLAKVLLARGDTNGAQSMLAKTIEMQPEAEPAYLMLAQLYISANQNAKALTELQVVLSKKPTDPAALMLRGMICNTETNYHGAAAAYEKLLAVAPNNRAALNNLAYLDAEHLGQLDKGYQLARQARDLAPDDPSVADTLGWILYQKGQYPPALDLLRESADKLYLAPEIQYHLGMAYYMLGDEANARTTLQRALELNKDFAEKGDCQQHLSVLAIDPKRAGASARAWLEKETGRQPDDTIALLRLAAIYRRDGATDKAVVTYQAILNANPQNVTALANLARLFAPTDPQKACAFAKSAYKLAPNDPEITFLSGHLAFVTGDYPWALNLLQLSAHAHSQDPAVLFELGEAFYSMGKIPEAKAAMQSALQTRATFSQTDDARRCLEMISLAQDPQQASTPQAQSTVEEILHSNPTYVPALMVEALVAAQKADSATAEQTFEEVLKIYPDFAPAQKELAIIYSRDPNNDIHAYSLAVKARVAFPDDPKLAGALGMIICRQGDYSRAAGLLQESARQLNPDPELLYYLGLAQYHLNHDSESKAALQHALALNLPGKDGADARRILAELR